MCAWNRLGRIDLTRKGRQFAERLACRHQLAEMLLTDVIGLPWSKETKTRARSMDFS